MCFSFCLVAEQKKWQSSREIYHELDQTLMNDALCHYSLLGFYIHTEIPKADHSHG